MLGGVGWCLCFVQEVLELRGDRVGSSQLFYPWSLSWVLSLLGLSALPRPSAPLRAGTLSSPSTSPLPLFLLLLLALTFRVGVAIHSCCRDAAILIAEQVGVRVRGRLCRLLRSRALRGHGCGAWSRSLVDAPMRALGAGLCASCTVGQQASVLLGAHACLLPSRSLSRGLHASACRGWRAGRRVPSSLRLAPARSCLRAHAHRRCVCVCTSRVDALLMSDANSQVFIFGGSDFFSVLHFLGV